MSLATERRAARERALGLLYEAEVKGVTGAEVLATLPVAPDPYAAGLVTAVDEHRTQIDDLLGRFAEGWTLARMAALDRAALRMATAELIVRPDVPTGVILAEAVELATRFSTDGSGRFVNGLLARVARELRGEAGASEASEAGKQATLHDGLIVDLDGVIRHWDSSYYPEADARLGVPDGTLVSVALEADRLARATDGRLSFEAWCEEIADVLAADHGADRALVIEAWASSRWHIDLAVLELITLARRTVPVALLSNASSRLREDLEASDIAGAFDAIVGSADIGVAKPDGAAYLAAAQAIGVPPDRCLFIDDLPANVDGARSVGMAAEHFTGADELRERLRESGLIT